METFNIIFALAYIGFMIFNSYVLIIFSENEHNLEKRISLLYKIIVVIIISQIVELIDLLLSIVQSCGK